MVTSNSTSSESQMTTGTFLLVGGAGFIGQALAKALCAAGWRVIIYDHSMPKLLYSLKAEFIEAGLPIVDSIIRTGLPMPNLAIHLASTMIPGSPIANLGNDIVNNLVPFVNIVNELSEAGVVRHVFFSSGGSVYGRNGEQVCIENSRNAPINPYGWMKLAQENFLRMITEIGNISSFIVRPSNVYGPGQNLSRPQGIIGVLLKEILVNHRIQIWGDGRIVRDYCYIDDLVGAIVALIKASAWGDTYNVGSGVGTSVDEIIEIFRKVTEIDFCIEYLPARKIDIERNVLAIDKVRSLTGWEPLTKLEAGIKNTWTWIRDTIGDAL